MAKPSGLGTRKFRVQVSHAVVPSVKSEPIYVTWDEWDIVGDLMSALHASTTADTSYTTAQAALLSCMNGEGASVASGAASSVPTPSFTSFDAILNSYTGTTKAKMDAGGVCSSQATVMFSTNQTVSRSKLDSLKDANSEYAALLETPQGQDFEEDLADPDTLKLVSYLGAHVAAPGSLEQPLYEVSGASVQSDTLPPGVTLEQGPGLACLPAGIDQTRLTLDNKLRVLNCLVFSTSHDFWVKGDGTRVADLLKGMIDSSKGRYNWLDRGDWECSGPPVVGSPQGPVPSCLKHDVAYGGLQKIAGMNTDAPNGTELDAAWNPRNKALADYKFRADIARWGCQDQEGATAAVLCRAPRWAIAEWPYFRVVTRLNHKGWPVTSRDISDFETRTGFINCAEPVVPEVRNVNIAHEGRTFKVSWDFVPGCVSATLADVWFDVEWGFANYPTEPAIRRGASKPCSVNGNRLTCSYNLNHPPPGTVVTDASIYVVPRDREYGGSNYGGEGITGRRSTVTGHYVLN